MYVYVYHTSARKYEVLSASLIQNFDFEHDNGNQSAQYTSRIFQCQKPSAKVTDCRVLTVSKTKEDLNALLASCRPRVSQFSQSSQNFVSQENENKSAATPTLESTKYIKMNLRKKCKNGITITDMAIINQSSASQPPRTLPKNLYASVPGPSKPYDPMSFTPSFENFGSTKDTSDTSNSENEDEYVPRDKKPNPYMDKLQEDLSLLKEMYLEADEKAKKILKMNDNLSHDNQLLKQQIAELQNRSTSEQLGSERQRQHCITSPAALVQSHAHSESNRIAYANIPLPEVLPVFNSMGTGVYAKQSLVEKAYEQHEPSKFYIKMCKATWSNQELSKRCIKKTKRSRGKKVLTPKRKRAVRGHFVKYLKDLQFPPLLQKIHITSINEYGRRAINAAGSHNQRNDGDEIDELDEDAEMIEL